MTLTDDEKLLGLAAKAAGWTFEPGAQGYLVTYGSYFSFWNPLADDGDALRLAVKLKIDIKAYDETVRAWVGDPVAQKVIASVEELCGTDPYAATRRAIVRAAAEIGKERP